MKELKGLPYPLLFYKDLPLNTIHANVPRLNRLKQDIAVSPSFPLNKDPSLSK